MSTRSTIWLWHFWPRRDWAVHVYRDIQPLEGIYVEVGPSYTGFIVRIWPLKTAY